MAVRVLTDEVQDELDALVRDAAIDLGERAISEDDGAEDLTAYERRGFLINACGWTDEEIDNCLNNVLGASR